MRNFLCIAILLNILEIKNSRDKLTKLLMIKSFYTDSRKFVVCRINYDPTKERISSKIYGNSHKVEVGS